MAYRIRYKALLVDESAPDKTICAVDESMLITEDGKIPGPLLRVACDLIGRHIEETIEGVPGLVPEVDQRKALEAALAKV